LTYIRKDGKPLFSYRVDHGAAAMITAIIGYLLIGTDNPCASRSNWN